ncbi:MAG: alanine racemase [Oscillospiraceae bacterium]|jgi:D-serine deaminase-like pyridoxal phosphate-dependent protein|nr:alanine racemase [Oscillospiraceae bacterium]
MEPERWLQPQLYKILGTHAIPSPALIFFEDLILRNTAAAIELAGGADRLIPHVKTHKCPQVVRIMMERGITRFKCATLAEACMLAELGARFILLAYPLVDPSALLFARLQREFPDASFYTIGDSREAIDALSDASVSAGVKTALLIDADLGMHRTGVALDHIEELYRYAASLPGIRAVGLHGYDGHIRTKDLNARQTDARPGADILFGVRDRLVAAGLPCDIMVMGGTPTFPVHQLREGALLSPGTIFLMDAGEADSYPDLSPFAPAAAVLARVVSRPTPNGFTIDVGTKAIASEMQNPRGVIIDYPRALPVIHSEEHWRFDLPEGEEPPRVGQTLLVIPNHVCPTCALYDRAYVVRNGMVQLERWDIARGRV